MVTIHNDTLTPIIPLSAGSQFSSVSCQDYCFLLQFGIFVRWGVGAMQIAVRFYIGGVF
jgi:hypothetical protein